MKSHAPFNILTKHFTFFPFNIDGIEKVYESIFRQTSLHIVPPFLRLLIIIRDKKKKGNR